MTKAKEHEILQGQQINIHGAQFGLMFFLIHLSSAHVQGTMPKVLRRENILEGGNVNCLYSRTEILKFSNALEGLLGFTPRVADSAGRGCSCETSLSNMFPGNTGAASSALWEQNF